MEERGKVGTKKTHRNPVVVAGATYQRPWLFPVALEAVAAQVLCGTAGGRLSNDQAPIDPAALERSAGGGLGELVER